MTDGLQETIARALEPYEFNARVHGDRLSIKLTVESATEILTRVVREWLVGFPNDDETTAAGEVRDAEISVEVPANYAVLKPQYEYQVVAAYYGTSKELDQINKDGTWEFLSMCPLGTGNNVAIIFRREML